ncbi:MAG: GNAT family N-acetyltransferase [Flavobacteriales bacterium]|nr:GNAT family N-acetyltransferase [Flavobacteriales bacterium]
MIIRAIEPRDNKTVAQIIVETLAEYGAKGDGFASADPELKNMFAAYQLTNAAYFVIEDEGRILGCGGIGPLKNGDSATCELQKMYFRTELRGRGWGKKLIAHCLRLAKSYGYSKCYIETLPNMVAAQAVYKLAGFDYIPERMGNTGHSKCHVFMLKNL